ncbi:FGGY family carbohydrate kinase [Pararhizobium sp. BT-229]|uniref:FGGY-family carbohydrate kinase n=1 Tax=Pararhizobium sp. BT-229 TaxID=2986923 RepID=UPI0021F7049E|nr:FGGY family carbohydrate kinase [Pararhizobium sp. BT-229]MCV9967242.1 FGGY family carbohydrate kinase [Pararhizobium sp. BT-229]
MADGHRIDRRDDEQPATIAVLDVGKTNVKLNAVTASGAILETLSVPNPVVQDGLWKHHDLQALSDWMFENFAGLCGRHPLSTFVSSGHGSGGVLVGSDPDAGDGTALPMIDYEQALPDDVRIRYTPLSGSFLDRGSAVMHGATHQARQMYWMQQAAPEAFSRARWFLGIPQYWAWRLSGVAVSEATVLGAQSHLWNVAERRWSPIVGSQRWGSILPPFAKAWEVVGPIRPAIADRYRLPSDMEVLAGIHDSSANFYRYQAAGFDDATVVSTGTWIVALSGKTPIERLDEHRGMTCNSDVDGRPVGGALTMGGREFTHVTGHDDAHLNADATLISRMIGQGTMALPSFGDDDGLFPGSAGEGHIAGPQPIDGAERKALAVLYMALLTVECLDVLGSRCRVILDGSFLRDPLYAALVAALRPQGDTLSNLDTYGVASGAALLASHGTRSARVAIALEKPPIFHHLPAELAAYVRNWQAAVRQSSTKKPNARQERSTP